jgi:hypothetical protein
MRFAYAPRNAFGGSPAEGVSTAARHKTGQVQLDKRQMNKTIKEVVGNNTDEENTVFKLPNFTEERLADDRLLVVLVHYGFLLSYNGY